ncbi:MAG: hypothetical protein ABIK86_01150 [candidate division WOR-3 bacterium]
MAYVETSGALAQTDTDRVPSLVQAGIRFPADDFTSSGEAGNERKVIVLAETGPGLSPEVAALGEM